MNRVKALRPLQVLILRRASERESKLVFPISDEFANDEGRVARLLAPLRRRGLVAQGLAGLIITDKGIAEIANARDLPLHDKVEENDNGTKPSKSEKVLSMLAGPGGASIADLAELTGWQPHSVRAVLTSFRRKGHRLASQKVDGRTIYRTGEADQ